MIGNNNPFLAFESFAKGFSGAWAEHAATTAKWSTGLAEEQMAFIRKQSALAAKCFQTAMTCRTPEDFAALSIDAAKGQAELAFDQAMVWLEMGQDLAANASESSGMSRNPGAKEAFEKISESTSKAMEGLETAKQNTMDVLDKAIATLRKKP